MWSCVFRALLILLTPLIGAYGEESAKIYILGAPRSGHHWFSYCSNFLFKETNYTEAAHNPFDLQLGPNSHNEDLLILLLRNYRECMLRDYGDPEAVKNEILRQAFYNYRSNNIPWVMSLRMNHYFHNLRVYDKWNPEKRLIVYYEELLESPREVLLQVANFLGETDKSQEIQAFVDDIETHFENSLKRYEKVYISHTRGKSLLYHTNKIGKEKALEIDQLVVEHFPDFAKKYLAQYLLDPAK